jgi:hypothetical protein
MVKKNNKLLDEADPVTLSISEKEDIEISSPNEEIQSTELLFPAVGNIKGCQPIEPNALTMTKRAQNTKNTPLKKTKKIGDGAFIAAEDR